VSESDDAERQRWTKDRKGKERNLRMEFHKGDDKWEEGLSKYIKLHNWLKSVQKFEGQVLIIHLVNMKMHKFF
jgi:stalled ribosome alternative rescue factor ArfA